MGSPSSVGQMPCTIHPSTMVMKSDASWSTASTLREGDMLYGFTNSGDLGVNRIGVQTRVSSIGRVRSGVLEITTRTGRQIKTHPSQSGLIRLPSRTVWRPLISLSLESRVFGWGLPSSAIDINSEDYAAGYVAGVTNGDGTLRYNEAWRSDKLGFPQMYWRVAMLESDKGALLRVQKCLNNIGVSVEVRPFSGSRAEKKQMLKLETRAKRSIGAIVEFMRERDVPAYKAGWLAGFLDTDGFCSGSAAASGVVHRWSQVYERNDYLDRTVRYVNDLGFRCTLEHTPARTASTVALNVNSVEERFRFIGMIRPALNRKGVEKVYGSRHAGDLDGISSIRLLPDDDLVTLTTESGTLVAGGFSLASLIPGRHEIATQEPSVRHQTNGFPEIHHG